MGTTSRGKFLFLGEEKIYLKAGVPSGNTIWLSDTEQGVLDLGLPEALRAEFAGRTGSLQAWKQAVRRKVASASKAVVAFDIGGPIPAPLLKWLGPRRAGRILEQACRIVKTMSHETVVTATCDEETLPLVLPHVDFVTCEFDAEPLAEFRLALARVQHRVGDRPLVARCSIQPRRPLSLSEQAQEADHRIRMTFQAGCAGIQLVNVPDSGPVAATVQATLALMPFSPHEALPRMSVVVCVYNGEDTIGECLDGLHRVDYPDFEVIVVDDGSRDGTLALARERAERYGFRVVPLFPNGGLSAARNAGMEAATGEIVAYLDADAFPDVHWLRYLALGFLTTKHAVIGGPNLNPLAAGLVSDCVDHAPGNPQVVMADTELADHVPGCNLAVRRAFLQTIGGFDPGFRGAGDDVVFCWRVLQGGGTLGVAYGAMVWHYRRPTVAAFLRQQRSYGCGEAWLEQAWPERFNGLGHQVQAGSAPGRPRATRPLGIYQSMGDGPLLLALARMPEWPLVLMALALLTVLGVWARPLLWFGIPFGIALGAWLAQAVTAAASARLRVPSLKWRALTAWLHLTQPVARLRGRLSQGLTPWRRRCSTGWLTPRARVRTVDVSDWPSGSHMGAAFGTALRTKALPFVQAGSEPEWDWQVEGGLLGGVRCLLHKSGSTLSMRVWPYAGHLIPWLVVPIVAAAAGAWWAGTLWLAALLWLVAVAVVGLAVTHMGAAMASVWPLTAETEWHPSPWDRFKPCGHVDQTQVRSLAS